ncbi:putative eka-like protein [Erysiphe necator]|uniref:Putative eka-like protein n=1 Tax=Uncinula necator TaxID=52586 RepID=A0A0B1PAJ1_UNCNE|nr:putative eka-like protein [Erysiphe necator]
MFKWRCGIYGIFHGKTSSSDENELLNPPYTQNSTTPPSPPQNNKPPGDQVLNRKILEPVIPTKRVASNATDSTKTSHSNEVEDTHPYIPRELLEIFTARQRQEKAWLTRLLVCTCFLSGIDRTVSNFKEGAEKEMAKTIQAYLRPAISEFAAVDTIPDVLNFFPAETLLYDPLPSITKNIENCWASVARNGHKKPRTTKKSVLQTTQAKKQNTQTSTGLVKNSSSGPKEITTCPQNKRLFLRLTNDHEWRKLSPAGIREIVVKKLSTSSASISKIKPVRSGFALSLYKDQTRQEFLKAAIRLSPFDAKLEAASNWTPAMVPTIPKTINTLEGKIEVTKDMLANVIERVFLVRPALLKMFGRNIPDAPHRTWMAYFSKAPRPGFRVSDESGIVRKFKKRQPLDFCKRCNGHHSPKNCSRAPSCGNCGSNMHTEDLCMASTKCENFGCPHRSDSYKCLARPTRAGKPTKEQFKIFRQAGDRDYQAIVRAKIAEERAATIESDMDIVINSQSENKATENSQASSVESLTEDARRL